MHPPFSACGTATYTTARFITKILQNYCGKTSSCFKDSTDFIQKIKHFSINTEEETLVPIDVTALFTSIPVPVALQVINSKISTCTNFTNVCKIPIENFIMLLEFTLTKCIFCFNKKFCKPLQGVAMVSPVSPVIANIYMEVFETSRTPQFHRSVHQIHHRTHRNRWIHLPRYLTTSIPNSTESTVYSKPTHTDGYLHYNSIHPISAKLSVILNLIHRAKQVYAKPEISCKRNWSPSQSPTRQPLPNTVLSTGQTPNRKPTKSLTHPQGKFIEGASIVIPYIKGLSKQYRHTLAKYKSLEFSFKGPSTIKSLLVHPKDPIQDSQKLT